MASETRDFDPRFDPAFQRGYMESGVAPEPPRSASGGSSPEPRHPEPVFETERSDAAAPGLAGNPWVRVLWVVAAVFTAGGIAGQAYSQYLFGRAPVSAAFDAYVLPSLLQALSPWVLGAGLAAGIGVTLLHAARWRPGSD